MQIQICDICNVFNSCFLRRHYCQRDAEDNDYRDAILCCWENTICKTAIFLHNKAHQLGDDDGDYYFAAKEYIQREMLSVLLRGSMENLWNFEAYSNIFVICQYILKVGHQSKLAKNLQ